MARKGNAGAVESFWATAAQIARVWGIQINTLKDRGVVSREDPEYGDRLQFELADFWLKCRDLMQKRMADLGELDVELLKAEEVRERIRKLRIENDLKDGTVVLAEDVEVTYGKSIRAICDELDGVITAIKIAIPDVSQAVLSTVADKLSEARRKAARIDFGSLE